MTKKNLPNIPIYIGDWERDCNVLSLEAEGAWLKIVFKLWSKGKQNSIKIKAKYLQNLWRCSSEKVYEIIEELSFNDICDLTINEDVIEFTCRRFVKENEISKIRSKAGSTSKKESKDNQNLNKTKSKPKQTPEDDYENENVIKNKTKNIIYPFDSENFKLNWQKWKDFKKVEFNFNYKSKLSEQGALKKLSELSNLDEETAIKIIHQSITEGWKGLFELKNKNNEQRNNNNTSGATDEFRRKTAERLGIIQPAQM